MIGQCFNLVSDDCSASLKSFDNFTTGVNGIVGALEIDTNFYKGNFPESCQVSCF